MAPKLIIGERASGRTTALIKAAAEDEARGVICYIVCRSHEECYRVKELSKEMNLNIGFPLTYDEFLHRSYHGTNVDTFYIDNLRMLLAHICPLPIEMVVW